MSLQDSTDYIFNKVAHAATLSGREASEVSVIAVTKYVDVETTKALLDTGVKHLGENRVDKFLEKYQALNSNEVTWHFIGTLQRRKVKEVLPFIDYFHALDSLSLAREIQKRAEKPVKCFLQVNVSGEATKHGFSPDDLEPILSELAELDHIELVGLMTMAPFEATSTELTEIFKRTKSLQEKLQAKQLERMPFTELSMGMSNDYALAIQQGATYVRIGTAFFEAKED